MHLAGILGLVTILTCAWLLSNNRRAIRLKTVAWGLGLQIVFAFLVLRWTFGRYLFHLAGDAVNWLLDVSFKGSEFVFGTLGQKGSPLGFFFAFRCYPPSYSSPPSPPSSTILP
jgi:CNT family concentrative nucleoside transporter